MSRTATGPTLVDRFTVGDVTVYRDGSDPAVLYTAPASLRVVRAPNGRPAFSLIRYGGRASMMLETEWVVPEGLEQQIRDRAVAAAAGVEERQAAWRVVPVPIAQGRATLRIHEPGAGPELLAEARPSGMGSMRATFSAQLPGEVADRVERALFASDADVVASYELDAAASVRASASWQVELDRVRRELETAGLAPTPAAIAERLPDLMGSGAVRAELAADEAAVDEREGVERTLAALLVRQLERGAGGTARLTATTTRPRPLTLRPHVSLRHALAESGPPGPRVGGIGDS